MINTKIIKGDRKVIGIYQIRNKHNNRKYVGKSSNLMNRWNTHLTDLINNKHCNKYLQSDFIKYGYSGFIFEILELCIESEMNDLESKYIGSLEIDDYNIIGIKSNNKLLIEDIQPVVYKKSTRTIYEKVKMYITENYKPHQRIKKFQFEFNLNLSDYRKFMKRLKEDNVIYTKNRNAYLNVNVSKRK